MTTEGDNTSEKELEEVRARIRGELRGFAVTDSASDDEPRSITVAVTPQQLPVPRLVELVLTWGLGATAFGPEEKRAWLVPFLYDGRPCSIGLYKFGLRLHVRASNDEEAHAIATAVIKEIDSAIHVAEGEVLVAYAEAQVRAGNLTVRNKYYMFQNMYRDFRSQLEVAPTDAENAQPTEKPASFDGILAEANARIATDRRRFHLSIAMVNAFFSLLEHCLVLIWPFMGTYQPGVNNPEKMIRSFWGDKFKTVFDVEADAAAQRIRDRLRDIAEDYRNTFDHGGFDKKRGSLLVHFPGGAIPASLSDARHSIRPNFFPVAEPEISDIFLVLDEVEAWLHEGPARLPMMFVESGIDVPFDGASLEEIRSQMTTAEAFEDYLRGLSRWLDDQTNMDW